MTDIFPFRRRRARSRGPRIPAVPVFLLAIAIGGLAWLAAGSSVPPPVPQRNETLVREAPASVQHFAACGSFVSGNCVIDGDTFTMNGERIRIADIDAPETRNAQCAAEARLGARATERLRTLLNEGPFELGGYARDTDRYGRKLRIVRRNGQSIGDILIREGLARRWDGARRSWCA